MLTVKLNEIKSLEQDEYNTAIGYHLLDIARKELGNAIREDDGLIACAKLLREHITLDMSDLLIGDIIILPLDYYGPIYFKVEV